MIVCMRTTISLDDRIFEAVNVLDDAVKRDDQPAEERPFQLIVVGGGGPYPQIDLDRPRELMVAEDEERYG